ncbi:MAG: hypothetical protein V4671_32810 [Armatimonadota bacterium]
MSLLLMVFAGSAVGLYLPSPAIPSPQDSAQKPRASPAWPAFIRLPDADVKTAAQAAQWIADYSRQFPGSSIVLALLNPPSAADVARLLPTGKPGPGSSRITLASGAVLTFLRVQPGETKEEVSRRAFSLATVSREQLVSVLKNLPTAAMVTMEKPGRRTITVTGDIPRAIKLVNAAPPGTRVSAKWANRSVRYPRLK